MILSRRDTGKVRGGRVRRFRAFAFLLPAFLLALLPTFAGAAIVHQATITGDTGGSPGTQVLVNNVTPGPNQLYLVSVAIYGTGDDVASVSGGGLTWTLQKAQCSARLSQPKVEIWQAFGSPSSTFTVTVTLDGTADVISAAVSRYSGVDSTTPTEGAAGSNTHGQNGICDGNGTDNTAASLSLTSSNNNSVLYVATHPRNNKIDDSPVGDDPDYTERAHITNSDSSEGANLHVHDRTLAIAGTDSADHTLASSKDWDMAGVVINPASVSATAAVTSAVGEISPNDVDMGSTGNSFSYDIQATISGSATGVNKVEIPVPASFGAPTVVSVDVNGSPVGYNDATSGNTISVDLNTKVTASSTITVLFNSDAPGTQDLLGVGFFATIDDSGTGEAAQYVDEGNGDGDAGDNNSWSVTTTNNNPAVTSAVAEISPNDVSMSTSANAFSYDIQTTISGAATGVDRVTIPLPSGFSSPAVTAVQVNGSGVTFTDNTAGTTVSVDLSSKVTTSGKITVLFTANAPTTEDLVGVNFTSTVDDSSTGAAAQSTTQGNGDGDPGDNDSWTVTTTDNALAVTSAVAEISPADVGTNTGYYAFDYDIAITVGAGETGVDRVAITVPASFGAPTIKRVRVNGTNVGYTNNTSGNNISVDLNARVSTSSTITVQFISDPPATQDLTGVNFTSTVDESTTSAAAVSTTEGNGDGDAGDDNTWKVTTTDVPAGSCPAVDGVASTGSADGTNSITISHTTSGTDRLMLVGVSINNEDFETVSSVTYNGVALTHVGSATEADDAVVEIWRLVNPPTGTHNVVITFSAVLTREAVAGVMTFTGVDQTTPLGTFASAIDNDSGPASVIVSSAAGELVFGVVSAESSVLSTAAVAPSSQRWNLFQGIQYGAGATQAGAASVTMSWTFNGSDHWAAGGVSIKPSGSCNPAVTSAVAEISPNNVTTSSTGNSFSYDIQANISGAATGVNRVEITVPGTFGVPTVTGVQVDGGSVAYTNNSSGNTISVDLTTKVTASSKITVLFNADAPTTQDLTGVDFTSTVDDTGTGDVAQATTEGDGDGEPGDSNSWTVTTTDGAGGGGGGGACPAPGAGGWYPGGWLYRKPLSIGAGNVGSNLTDFPVLVSLASDTDLAADAQADFDDILFTAADGTTKLSHEIEKYNETTGELVAWVKVPTVSSSADTVFYMYYGNASATNQQDPTGVWSNGYAGVWHLKEDPSGTAPQMNDSTSNTIHGTSVGSMTSGNQIGGKIAGALDFDGSDDYLQSSDYDILSTITVSAWVNWDAISANNEGIVSKRTSDENNGNWALRFNSGLYEWMVWDGIDSSDKLYSLSAPTAGQWEYVVLTFDDPSNTAKIYIDGGLDNSTTSMTKNLADTPEIIKIAQHGQGSTTLNGKLDEVRLSSAVRSADWITAEYINQADHDNFQSLCAEETDSSTPAVTSAVAEISPNDVATNSTGNSFSYDIQATIGGGDTGVNRVTITVPGTFGAPTVSDVQDDGVSVGYTNNTVGNAISVDITTKITASSKITVLFDSDAPTTQDLTGVNFTSTVDDSGTGDAAQATTEGNGDGDAGDLNSWTVTTTDSTGLLARYWLDEAASGQVPANLTDSEASPLNLAITYVATSPEWQDGTGGNRHLRFYGTGSTTDTGGAQANSGATKMDGLHGSQTATLVAKYAMDSNVCTNNGDRIVGISDGDGSADGWLAMRERGSRDGLQVRWAGVGTVGFYALGNGTPSCPVDSASTVHWVIDTTQATAADRVKAYIDGVAQTVQVMNGALPPQNATIDLGPGTRKMFVGQPHTGYRTFRGRIWYAAIYDTALSSATVSSDASAINACDDAACEPAVTSAVAEITPNDVVTSSTGNSFTYDIQATISGSETGVNRVTITVPGTFGAPTVTGVQVGGVGVAYTDNTSGNNISIDLTTKVTTSNKITVLFNADAPTTQDLVGVDFLSTVDDTGTAVVSQSTTEGNGDGDAGDNNSWAVTTTNGGSGNLIGHWAFNDGSGQTATDSSASSNNGTLGTSAGADSADPAWVCSGTALDFDGSNDEVQLGAVTVGNSAAWTISAWIKMSADTADQRTIYSEGNTGAEEYLFLYVDDGPNTVRFYSVESGGSNYALFSGTSNVEDDTWHLVTLVQRSKTDRELYVDGISEATNTQNAGTYAFNTSSIGFLRASSWTADPFLGTIDDVRIYDYALTTGEIASLAAAPPSCGANLAVTSAVAEISPNDVITSSTGNAFSYDIQASIGGGDTGVNRVAITVPGTFGAPTVTDVLDDGVSVPYTDNTAGNAISVDLTTKITATSKITVVFTSNAPTTQDLTGVNFTSTVDDSGTGDAAQSTTEGNGDGDSGDNNSWTVTTTDGACPAVSTIFSDNFEGGNLNLWDTVSTGTGDSIASSTLQANSGIYSARAEVDNVSTARARVIKNFAGKTTVSGRAFIYLDPTWSTTAQVELLYLIATGQVLTVEVQDDMTLDLWNNVASESYPTTATMTKGTWHSLEIQAVINGASSEARLWLDDTLIMEQTGINLGSDPITQFNAGYHWAQVQTEANILYLDDAVLCDVPIGATGSAVTSAVAEITPNDVETSSTGNAFTYDIQATIGAGDTGVNRVAITVPAGFSTVSVTGVQVGGVGVAYTDNTVGNAISVDLNTKVTSSSKLTVLFTADAPTSQDLIGVDFTSTVDDSVTGAAAQATTEGNGDGDAGDNNSWTVTTTNAAVAAGTAVAEISPNDVATNSTANAFSYDIAVTIGGSDTGVNRVAITVPGSFGAPTVTAVQVDGVGVAYTNNTVGNNISVDLTTKVTASSKITVLFTSDAPTTQDLVGVNFTSTVDDSGTGASAQSTTQGNGDGNAGDNNSWVVTTTDTGGFSCPIGSSLFSDGFESGDFSAWDGNTTGTAGDSITVSTEQAKTGTYSAKGVSDTTYPAQAIVWKTVTGQTTIHAKAEIYLPTGFSGGSDLVALRFGNGWTNIVTATVNNDRTMFIWNDVVSEGYGVGTTPALSLDTWHTIELRTTISDTAGEARLWIDGTLEITATGKNLGTSNADRLDTPFYWGTPGTSADTIYVDDAVICGTPTPAVTSAVAEISPNDVTTSSTGNSFSYDIQATIGGGDTGVDRVAITVPGNFGAPTITGVQVDGVGVAYTNNTVGNAISVDLTTKVTASSKITILFDADGPTTENLTGDNFLSTVDDSGTADAAQNTTEGNGDGDAGDNNSWTVTTTDAAGGACAAFDASSTVQIPSTSPNPVTFSHTTSGSDRLLLVSVASQPNADDAVFEAVTGITYGGQALTVVGTAAQGPDNARIEIWQLVNPPTGSNTVSITFNDAFDDPVNGEGASAGAISFTGVHQTTPLGTFASAIANGTVADTPSVNVSSATGELVFDTVARKANPLTVDASQTERWHQCTDNGCSNIDGAASTEAGAASVTMSWSPDNTRWALGAVPIKPSGNCNSAVTSAVAEISPNDVTTSSTGNAFSYDITATIAGGDSGVNLVSITVPGSFGVPTVTDVLVDDLSVPYTDNTSGNAISVVLTSKLTTTGKITVLFSADAPTTQDLTGVDFVSTVDDNGTSDTPQATTEGNGDGNAGDNNSWTVTTTDGGGGGPANPVVNSTGDAGDANAGNGVCDTGGLNSQSNAECTLRAAIQEANATAGLDTIIFNMPTSEPGYSGAPLSYTINPGSALPTISDQVVIDGTTQTGYPGTPIVVLDGNNVAASGLTLGGTGDTSTIRGLVIRDFGTNGIQIEAGSDSHTIAGNYIGRLNASGTDAGVGEDNASRGIEVLGSSSTIGGTVAADRNVISGNGGEGIIIRSGASSNIVRGNYIGTAADGTTALGNGQEGIQIDTGSPGTIIGGSAAGAGNVIGANGISSGAAVSIGGDGSDNTVVQGNYIGTDAGGTLDLGNIRSGVEVRGTGSAATSPLNTLIGGTAAGEGNVIRYNDLDGVRIRDVAVDVAILGNQIDSSSQQGIDLWAAGSNDNVTANDAGDGDSGANHLMNYPVITSAIWNAGNVDVNFDLDVPAGNYRVEFFKNPSGADPSGNGEGETYLSSVNIAHGGSGSESFAHSFSGAISDILSATATEEISGPAFRNTSEFSATYTVTAGAAVAAAVAEISPNDVTTSGGTYLFEYDIAATIGAANTGVDRVAITVPASFGVSSLPVMNVLIDGVSVTFTDNSVGNAISVDLTTKVTTNARITVLFEANAPSTEDLTGVDFTSTVDDSATGDAAQAATEGEGDGDTEDNNSWTVTTTGAGGGGGGSCLVIDGTASTGSTETASMTISHTTSGTDRLMLVGVSINNNNDEEVVSPSGITYNGVALTRVGFVIHQGSGGNDGRVEIWRLLAPATGTHNVVVNFTADLNQPAIAGVMTFTGVDQTTPLGAFASNYGTSNAASVSVTSAVDETVFAVMSGETVTSVATDAPAAEQWNLSVVGSLITHYGAGATEDGAATTTVDWSLGSSDYWAAAGVSIKGQTGCGTAAGAAVAEISPNDVVTSSTGNAFAYDIQLTINNASHSGVDRIAITVPGTFGAPTVTDVLVNGVSVSHTDNTSGNDISIDLASKLTSDARVTVLFNADAPTTQDLTGKDFTSTVDDMGSPDAPQSTTEGNGDGDAGDNNDWTVTTTDPVGASCDIDPAGTYIEAENYTSLVAGADTGTFTVESTQAGYNGTGYLISNNGDTGSPPDDMRADYTVNFTTTGTYYIWVRGYALDSSSDSVWIGLDGTEVGALNEGGTYNEWIWTNSLQTGVNTINIPTAGWYTINLWVRESSHKVDGIYITQDAGGIPGGTSIGIPETGGGGTPGTFTQRVTGDFNDAEQRASSTWGMDLTSSDLELHNSGGDGYVGMRWTGVSIPQGATIDDVRIQFHVDEIATESSQALTVTFRGEDADNASIFASTASDISNRTETTASVDWAIPTWVTVHDEGAAQLSADLSPIVQEIVDRGTWSSGNAMVIMIKAWSGTGRRTAEAYDGELSGASAPEITVDYTTGGAGTPVTVIDPSNCAGGPGITHFAIIHDGTGINCQAENITIEAHDSSHTLQTAYAGTLVLSTSTTHGSWSLVTGSGSLTSGARGNAVYGFSTADSGSVVLGLRDTFVETTNIDVNSGGMTEHSTEDPDLAFARSGFNFLADSAKNTIGVQIAGKPSNVAPGVQTLELQAIKTNDDTGQCEAALTGPNVIDIGFECEDPDTCATNSLTFGGISVPANDNAAVPTYARVSMDFGSSADDTATFTMQYNDVGKVKLYARNRLLPSGEEMLGGSNSFVVRPFAFDMTITGNPAATSPSDPVFVSAGEEFTADVTALLWEAGDDTDNDGIADNHDDTDPSNNADLSDNAAAPNYGYETAIEQVLLTAVLDQPAGGANPGLAGGTSVTVFTAGTGTTDTVRYDEVGIIEISAQVSDSNYLGIGGAETAKITSKSGYVGRFNPAQYDVTAGDINPACSATFTYARQPFTGSMTIEAQNAAAAGNTRTENYRGAFVTLDPNAELVFINSATTTAYDSQSVTYNQSFDAGNFGEAVLALQFRWDMGEQVPTTSTVQNTGVTDEVNTLASAPVSIGSSPTRFGRALVGTAAGSELVDLGVVMRTEYYLDSTSGYVVNTDDFCSMGATLSLSNFADNLSIGETCVQDTGNPGLSGAGCTVAGPVLERYEDPLLAGDANLFMKAPGAGNDGSANVDADVPGWLEFDWNTSVPGLEDPSGHIVFGIYGGDKNQVYRRELY